MPRKSPPALTLDLDRARAAWSAHAGLESPSATPADAARAAGWARTLGGIDAYVALKARAPGLGRADFDAALAAGDVRISPAVRGCIYLVPGDQAPLALKRRLVGVWEYDPAAADLVWATFDSPGAARAVVEAAVAATAAFVRDEVGHGRANVLDTDPKLQARADAIRDMR